jgi:hypothetical protein
MNKVGSLGHVYIYFFVFHSDAHARQTFKLDYMNARNQIFQVVARTRFLDTRALGAYNGRIPFGHA